MRTPVSGLLGGLMALLALGCMNDPDGGDAAFDYGESEMRAAIEGTWEPASPGAEGVRLRLTYARPDVAPLCTTRELSAEGALGGAVSPSCMDMSKMNLTGVLADLSSGADEAPFRGAFWVNGLRFGGSGWVDGEIGDGVLSAELSNGVLEGQVHDARGDVALTFTLTRRK